MASRRSQGGHNNASTNAAYRARTQAPGRDLRARVGAATGPRAKARRRVVVAENLLMSLAAADWGLEHRADLRGDCRR